jgi:plasmid replication initiation protein
MDNTLSTIDSITQWLTDQVEQKQPISPDVWLEASARINVLLQGEQEKLFTMEQQVAIIRGVLLDSDKSVAYAKSKVEESDVYKQARIQKSKIERALELIRIAKLQSRMASEVMRGN